MYIKLFREALVRGCYSKVFTLLGPSVVFFFFHSFFKVNMGLYKSLNIGLYCSSESI